MPLLLQIGFGLSPFESGSLTFAAAAGAMVMKFTASRLIKQFGFRTILISNAIISGAIVGLTGLRSCWRRLGSWVLEGLESADVLPRWRRAQ